MRCSCSVGPESTPWSAKGYCVCAALLTLILCFVIMFDIFNPAPASSNTSEFTTVHTASKHIQRARGRSSYLTWFEGALDGGGYFKRGL